MASFPHLKFTVFLMKMWLVPCEVVSDTPAPTAVVVISDVIASYNSYLPQIFEKMGGYTNDTVVEFKTVIAQNETETIDEVCSHLAAGVFALVDLSTPRLAPLFKSACQAFGIAYISMVDTSYYQYPLQSANNDVFIEPAATQMLMVIANIVLQENLNNVAIVHDESFDIQNTPRRVLTNVPAQHLYIRISDNRTQATAHVNTLIKISIKTIFVVASAENAQSFVRILLEEKVVNFDPHIFILTKDFEFGCKSCPGDTRLMLITAVQSVDARAKFLDFMQRTVLAGDTDVYRIKVDEAMAFDVARLVINAVSDLATSQGGVHDIDHLDCYNISTLNGSSIEQSERLARSMSQSSILGVFGPLSLTSSDDVIRYEMTLQIREVILEQGKQKSKDLVAKWTKSSQIYMIAQSLIKTDIRKKYRVVTVAGVPPFVFQEAQTNGSVKLVGYCIDLLDELAHMLNFEYTIYESDSYGLMDAKGQWSGAVLELIEGRADIAVGPISVMAERENVIDFTVPYYDLVGLTILMKKPTIDYSLVKFLSVLDEEVWGCIIAAFFLFSILITVFDKLSPFSYQNRRSQWKETGPEPKIFTFKEGVWFCMMSLTPQGGGETPKALSGRLIAATWWLFAFVIIATYTANLAAFLTVSRLETPIESLDDLSTQFKIKYGPVNGSTTMTYFQRMADIEHRFYEIWKNMSLSDTMTPVERAQLAVWDYPVSDKYTKLWETMTKSPFPENRSVAIQKVLAGDYALIADATSNKYSTLTDCDLTIVGEEFSRKPYALAVQEGSSLRGELSNAILTLINNRTLETLKTDWWKKIEKQCPKVDDESDGISIKNIGGVFLVIVIGSGLSLITLAFECYWYRYRPARRAKKLGNLSNRSQLATSVAPSNNHTSSDDAGNSKTEQAGQPNLSGTDAGLVSPGFELSENNLHGYINTGFEQTERF